MSEFQKERLIRSAKKEHTCYLCGEKIEKGSMYRKMIGKSDDDFYSIALHTECHCMVEAYCAENYIYLNQDEGWDKEVVITFIHEWLIEEGLFPEGMTEREAVLKWIEMFRNR